jgi:hypothetical protein
VNAVDPGRNNGQSITSSFTAITFVYREESEAEPEPTPARRGRRGR